MPSSPAAIARVLAEFSCCIICLRFGHRQYLWKKNAATTLNKASAARPARLEAHQQHQAAQQFDRQSHGHADLRQRQAGRRGVAHRAGKAGDLAPPSRHEEPGQHEAPDQGKRVLQAGGGHRARGGGVGISGCGCHGSLLWVVAQKEDQPARSNTSTSASCRRQAHLRFVLEQRGVAGASGWPMTRNPRGTSWYIAFYVGRQGQRGAFGAVEEAGVDPRVGVDLQRAVGASGAPPAAAGRAFRRGIRFLLVAGLDSFGLRLDPDLQEMRGLALRMVELAVLHAGAGAHALDVAGRNRLDVAQRVLVGETAGQDVADDLHVAVAVGAEAGARRDAVLVDHPQVAKSHVPRVVVIGEREAVKRLEPAVVGVAAFTGLAQAQHDALPGSLNAAMVGPVRAPFHGGV